MAEEFFWDHQAYGTAAQAAEAIAGSCVARLEAEERGRVTDQLDRTYQVEISVKLLPVWAVEVALRSGISDTLVRTAHLEVVAASRQAAGRATAQLAESWPEHDPRIQPQVQILGIERI